MVAGETMDCHHNISWCMTLVSSLQAMAMSFSVRSFVMGLTSVLKDSHAIVGFFANKG